MLVVMLANNELEKSADPLFKEVRTAMSQNSTIKCPTCKKQGAWFDGSFGPFCSKRCKLVDLGKWFGEEMTISEPLRPDMFDGYSDLPPGEYLDNPERPDHREG